MYINLFLLCVGFIYVKAYPTRVTIGDAKIFDQFDSYMNATCPSFRDNVLVNRTNKYLLTCKDVELQDPPETAVISNCIAIIASNVQLCKTIGNRPYTSAPNTVDELYELVDKLKVYKPLDICKEIAKFDLFQQSANITYIDKWTKILLQIYKTKKCLFACVDMADDNTNLECSLLYFINAMANNVTVQNEMVNATETHNIHQKIGTEHVSTDITATAPAAKIVETTVNATKTVTKVEKSELVQNATHLNVKPAESNSVLHTTTVQPPPEIKQRPLNVSSSPKLEIEPPLPPNKNTAANQNASGSSAIMNPKPETTIPEDLTTHLPMAPAVPAKLKPAVPQVDLPQSGQNSIEIGFTNDQSTMAEIRDNQEDDYQNEDGEEETVPNENNKPAQVISGLNDNDIYGSEQKITTGGDHFVEVEDSNFFSYFMFISVMFIVGYVVYHNKQKIMALLLEGRRDRNSKRRPNTSSYRKLNSNLEEAVTSKCSGTATHVIY